jgi:thioredoxin 1
MVKEIETKQEYLDLMKLNKLVIIDCYTDWCKPCKIYSKSFSDFEKRLDSDNIIFAKTNIEKLGFLGKRFEIRSVPTTLFLKNGGLISKEVGIVNFYKFKEILEMIKGK